MNLFELNPLSAIANLLRIAHESGKRRGTAREVIIGSAPYYPPEDNGIPWERSENGECSRPYVNRKAARPPEVTVPQWCGRCKAYTDHATGRCATCGR